MCVRITQLAIENPDLILQSAIEIETVTTDNTIKDVRERFGKALPISEEGNQSEARSLQNRILQSTVFLYQVRIVYS